MVLLLSCRQDSTVSLAELKIFHFLEALLSVLNAIIMVKFRYQSNRTGRIKNEEKIFGSILNSNYGSVYDSRMRKRSGRD